MTVFQFGQVEHGRDERLRSRRDNEVVVGNRRWLAVGRSDRDRLRIRIDIRRSDPRSDIEVEGGCELLAPHHCEIVFRDSTAEVIR